MPNDCERVVVFAGPTLEADLVLLRLQDAGLDARLAGDNVGTWTPHLAAGGSASATQVTVPAEEAEKAAAQLSQLKDRKVDDSAMEP